MKLPDGRHPYMQNSGQIAIGKPHPTLQLFINAFTLIPTSGDLTVLSDFIDMTKYRLNTHVGNAVEKGGPRGIMHLPSKPAFSEPLRTVFKIICMRIFTNLSLKP